LNITAPAECNIEVTDGTQNRVILMPGRHSPPPAGTVPPSETLQRPKRKTAKQKTEALQHLPEVGQGSLTPSKARRKSTQPAAQSPSPPADHPVDNPSQLSDSQSPAPNRNAGVGVNSSPQGGVITVDGVDFHHASEAEFARLLTYYGIEWQYEPNQFPLQWHEGRPTEMFSPDFYLTEYDLYIELTTMRQALVRRKNRKLRLLRALYPEINIKLLYRRDYQRLLERFGIKPEDWDGERPADGGSSDG
jgi:hypothetical protein